MQLKQPFNINSTVRVKLTDKGRHVHRIKYSRLGHEYVPPKEDPEGWSEWQLWVLMHDFGDSMSLGFNNLPFETSIQFITESFPVENGLRDIKKQLEALKS
jgi:hypothetical protein